MTTPAAQPTSPQAVLRAAGTGPSTWSLGSLFETVVSARETGSLALSLVTQPPGLATPLHRHTDSTEGFYLLDGTMTYRAGEQTYTLAAGDFIWLPVGLPHAFRVTGGTPVRYLGLVDPGGLFRLYDQVGSPASAPGLPPPDPDLVAEQAAHWLRLAPEYGVEVLGPPLPAGD